MEPAETTELVERKTLKRLGRYAIAEELARGGMAQLYVARKDGARELCVLKRLLVELETDETARARFQREAHVASYLSHPNIVKTIDAGFEGGTFCIASELVAGQTLELVLERLRELGRSLPPEAAIAIVMKLLDALSYAHALRGEDGLGLEIVHRDLSPRNILIDFGGEVKIIDFGVARGKLDQFRTAPGVVVGSLEYMSPEQASASPVDRRSDLYSVAVVLYEMLTGRYVVPRNAQLTESLSAIVRDMPPPVSVAAPHLSRALDPVLNKALAKLADERYDNADDFRADLAQASVGVVLTPAPILGMLIRDILPDEEKRMLDLIERAKKALDRVPTDDRVAPTLNNAKYEPTALVDRPRGGRARKVSITGVDEPPPEGTNLGAMVLDMPGEPAPLSRTVFETMRRKNKTLFYSLIALSVVAAGLLIAVLVTSLSPAPEASSEPQAVAQSESSKTPGVVSRVSQREPEEPARADTAVEARVAEVARTETKTLRKTKAVEKLPEKSAETIPAEIAPPVVPEKPPEEPKPEIVAPYPDLRKMLTQLRSTESKDPKTYYRLLGGIENAMSDLPSSSQKRIEAQLGAAQLTYDVDALGRALEELMKARAQST